MTSPLLRLGVAAVATVLLAGCGGEASPTATDDAATAAEPSAVTAPECPAELPAMTEADGAAATAEASAVPDLGTIEAAWHCTYNPGPGSDSDGTSPWQLTGERAELTGADLDTLRTALGDLAIPKSARPCTMDLGPRSLVLLQVEGGTVGVQMDHFGCRDTRLTSDPETSPAGTTSDLGTVPGVLTPSKELRVLLENAVGRG